MTDKVMQVSRAEVLERMERARASFREAASLSTVAANAVTAAWQAVLITVPPGMILEGHPLEEAAWQAREAALRAEERALDASRAVNAALRALRAEEGV